MLKDAVKITPAANIINFVSYFRKFNSFSGNGRISTGEPVMCESFDVGRGKQ
ncbi:hypothetical protein D3C83_253810 [compost metagenome]